MTTPATQIIKDEKGRPAFAVIPWDGYLALIDRDGERLSQEEIDALYAAKKEEAFPLEVSTRIIAGENPIKVYREHRGIKQKALAKMAGIKNPQYLSQIENGKRKASIDSLKKIAAALDVGLDGLTS